ncbi:MAG: hypothetical protein WCP97_00600 [bacterium]
MKPIKNPKQIKGMWELSKQLKKKFGGDSWKQQQRRRQLMSASARASQIACPADTQFNPIGDNLKGKPFDHRERLRRRFIGCEIGKYEVVCLFTSNTDEIHLAVNKWCMYLLTNSQKKTSV